MGKQVPYKNRRSTGPLVSVSEGCWVQYQLKLRNITLRTVAKKAGCCHQNITHFLKGRKNSDKIKRALADVLGYESFDALLVSAREKGAV